MSITSSPTTTVDVEKAPSMDEKQEEKTVEIKNGTPLPFHETISTARRISITFVLCMMTLALTFASTAYSSSLAHLEEYYESSRIVILLGVALFVLGFAVGPLLFGPMAQLIGNRPVYIGSYLCFTAFAFGASESKNIQTLIIMRFFSGVMGSSSLNNVPATIGQIVAPANSGLYMIWYALAAFGGPGLGPVIGSFVDYRAGFRWNLRVQAIFIAVTTVACILFVPETAVPLLKQRPGGKEGEASPSKRAFILSTCKTAIIGPFTWLATEPVILFISIYLSILYAILYAFFEVFPLVFSGIRHWSEESSGLVFVSLLIGFFFALATIVFVQQSYEVRERAKLPKGVPLPPEARLQQALWAAFLPPIGLFIFAWTAPFPHVHWAAPCVGIILFGQGMMIVFTSLIPYIVGYSGRHAPLPLAAATASRAALGAGFPLFTIQMYDAMTVQGATSLLAGIALLLVPMPYILKRYGALLRSKSRRATS
ncbi:hypothetical protein CBS101457_003068 [Exobasidium rhododendri]|nr:hypothetical protein CBS101457_003068 [Exobasidium rhododendri]